MVKMNVDINYFLDYMTNYEVNYILEAYEENYKEDWERIRVLAYTIVKVNSTSKSLKPSDVLKFDWDNKTIPQSEIMTNERFEELKSIYKKYV